MLSERPADFLVHELATGPLNAGIFPNRAFDPTLNPEVLFFHGPATPADVRNWDQAKRWFNFGTLEVGANGDLTARVVDTAGQPQFSLTLSPGGRQLLRRASEFAAAGPARAPRRAKAARADPGTAAARP